MVIPATVAFTYGMEVTKPKLVAGGTKQWTLVDTNLHVFLVPTKWTEGETEQ